MAGAENNPRERPILFNGEMVRAILAGRKVQTRRAVKPQPKNDPAKHHPIEPYKTSLGEWNWVLSGTGMGTGDPFPCPFGQPGDRLWVRETWRPAIIHSCAMDTCDCDGVGVSYAADGEWIPHTWQSPTPDDWYMPEAAARGNVASIHMPRWACRLVLEITAVRVERLQDISEDGALAGGVDHFAVSMALATGVDCAARALFRELWERAGGDWDSNPWVWVIEFKRIEVES